MELPSSTLLVIMIAIILIIIVIIILSKIYMSKSQENMTNNNTENSYLKYLKYKSKYLNLKNNEIIGGGKNNKNNNKISIFDSLIKSNNNFICSEFGILQVMSLFLLGVKNNSPIIKEISDNLHIEPKDTTNILETGKNINNINNSSPQTTLHFGNSLSHIKSYGGIGCTNIFIYNDKFKLLSDYSNKIKNYCMIESFNINDPGQENKINNQISKLTNNQVPHVIDKIEPDTSAILINVLTFDGKWKYPFTHIGIRQFGSNVTSRKIGSVETMNVDLSSDNAEMSYAKDNKYKHIKIPYTNNFYFVIHLPINEIDSPILYDDEMSKEINYKLTKINKIIMPKFTINTEINLKKILLENNITAMFSPRPDYIMFTDPNHYCSEFKQVAVIEVNEMGTKASAVTTMVMMNKSAMIREPGIDFIADHPFSFNIESANGMILFSGMFIQ